MFFINPFITEAVIIQKPVHWFANGLRHERVKDFLIKCDQIGKLQIWSHLLKKSLLENFIFYAVNRQRVFQESKISSLAPKFG